MKPFKDVVLHVGVQKTGTTSLQRTLQANRAQLIEHGVFYPKSSVGKALHLELLFLAMEEEAPKGLKARLKDPAAPSKFLQRLTSKRGSSGCDRLILSCEHLTNYPRAKHLEVLKAYLEKLTDKLVILAYIRPQINLIPSTWAQSIKSGKTVKLDVALENPNFLERFDYYQMLGRFGDVFGDSSVMVKPYERNSISSFLRDTGIEKDALVEIQDDWNFSLGAIEAEIMRKINKAGFEGETRSRLLKILMRSDGPKNKLTDNQIKLVQDHYADSNRKFFDRFGNDQLVWDGKSNEFPSNF